MFANAGYEKQKVIHKNVSGSGLGPFPRSVWIHPHTPEDDLDRVCFRIWRRSVLSQRAIWPHLAANAHRFMNDPLVKDIVSNINLEERTEETSAEMVVRHSEMYEINLMIQKEFDQILQQNGITTLSFTSSLGDNHDNPDEVPSVNEAQRRKIEKFLKDVLMNKQEKKKQDASEGPSEKKNSPLLCTTSPSSSKRQTFDDMMGSNQQKSERQQSCQRAKPVALPRTMIMEEIQECQDSKALNELCSQLPGGIQPMDTCNADGAHVPHNLAGAETGTMMKATGTPINAKNHFLQEHATVMRRRSRGSVSDKEAKQTGHMARVNVATCQQGMVELRKSSRCVSQKLAVSESQALALATGMPALGGPGPWPLLCPPPGFTVPQLSPQTVAMASLWLSCGIIPPVYMPVSFMSPVLLFQLFYK